MTEPELLRDYEIHLNKINQMLTDIEISSDERRKALSWWDDNSYRKLEDQYKQGIQDLIRSSDELVSFLRKKADLLERFGKY